MSSAAPPSLLAVLGWSPVAGPMSCSRWAVSRIGKDGQTVKGIRVPRRVICQPKVGRERGRAPTHTLGGRCACRATVPPLCTERVAPVLSFWAPPDVSGPSFSAALPVGQELRLLVGPPAQTSASIACPLLGALSLGRAGTNPKALFLYFQTRAGQVPGAPSHCERLC